MFIYTRAHYQYGTLMLMMMMMMMMMTRAVTYVQWAKNGDKAFDREAEDE